jgi:sugar/nucleoside kinase (ribokinase family)
VVAVADFGHGLIGPSTVATIAEKSRFLAIATQSNSANLGYNLVTRYPRADYVCVDEPEARLAVSDKFATIEEVVSEALPPRIDCDRFIVTHGNQGCVTYARGGDCRRIPAFTETVIDTMGAGDAFFAVTAPIVAAGGDMHHAGFIGNAVGALKVGIVGHRQSVEKASLLKYLITLLK